MQHDKELLLKQIHKLNFTLKLGRPYLVSHNWKLMSQ